MKLAVPVVGNRVFGAVIEVLYTLFSKGKSSYPILKLGTEVYCNMVFRYAGRMMHQRGDASRTRCQLIL
jgi:hypothetical protein